MGFDSVHRVEYKKIQQRYQIFRRGDNNDYSDLMLNLNTDTCKFLKGMQLNYLMRVINENFFKSANVNNLTCPLEKGLHLIAHTKYTDSFLPPTPYELHVKIVKEPFVITKTQKKWTRLYTMELFVRVKKFV
jgi:hypothetical protein